MNVIKNVIDALCLMVLGLIAFAAVSGIVCAMIYCFIYILAALPEIIVNIVAIILLVIGFIVLFIFAYAQADEWRENKQ